jgi:MoaA/NifB/PqqE/SkfB family radical SAM enzyme
MPSPEEISEVILHHFRAVSGAVASFGQGCEGEPLLRASDLAAAVRRVREKTEKGTINLNTNGSIPEGVKTLINAGLDSIRISLNSPTREYYTRYHRPAGFDFDDVMRSVDEALNAGIFVSLNLFFMPGFTDMETETEALVRFLTRFPVNMIQARNLNIDPDFYFDLIGFRESDPIGILNLANKLREKFPGMRLGYYNPSIKE